MLHSQGRQKLRINPAEARLLRRFCVRYASITDVAKFALFSSFNAIFVHYIVLPDKIQPDFGKNFVKGPVPRQDFISSSSPATLQTSATETETGLSCGSRTSQPVEEIGSMQKHRPYFGLLRRKSGKRAGRCGQAKAPSTSKEPVF